MLIVQLAPGASVGPQVPRPASAKSPLTVSSVKIKGASPVLVTVTNCAGLVVPTACAAKFSKFGERLTAGCNCVPMPIRLTLCGLSAALSGMVRIPVLVPVAVGVKWMLIVQLPPGASDGPQDPRPASAKSPLTVSSVKVSGAPPALVTVTNCAELVVPTGCAAKVNDV